MTTLRSSETSGTVHQKTQRHTTSDRILQQQNFKPRNIKFRVKLGKSANKTCVQ